MVPEKTYISASQIKTHRDCPRKWAFQKLTDLPKADTPALRFGKEGHARVEAYFKHETYFGNPLGDPGRPVDDLGRTIQQGVKFWPARDPEIQVIEGRFEISLSDGVYLIGYIDLQQPGLVIDWKFTSSLRWMMTEKEFDLDPQRIIYTRHGLKSESEVEASWVYYSASKKTVTQPMLAQADEATRAKLLEGRPRKPTGAKALSQRSNWRQIKPHWEGIVEESMIIANLRRTLTDPMQAEPCYTSCGKFGGCEFKDTCKPSANDTMRAAFRQHDKLHSPQSVTSGSTEPREPQEDPMGLFENLRGNPPPEPAAQEPLPPAPAGLIAPPAVPPAQEPTTYDPITAALAPAAPQGNPFAQQPPPGLIAPEPVAPVVAPAGDVVDLLNQGAPATPAGLAEAIDADPTAISPQAQAAVDAHSAGLPGSAMNPDYATACLKCGVEPGALCKTKAGKYAKRIHPDRKKTNLQLEYHGRSHQNLELYMASQAAALASILPTGSPAGLPGFEVPPGTDGPVSPMCEDPACTQNAAVHPAHVPTPADGRNFEGSDGGPLPQPAPEPGCDRPQYEDGQHPTPAPEVEYEPAPGYGPLDDPSLRLQTSPDGKTMAPAPAAASFQLFIDCRPTKGYVEVESMFDRLLFVMQRVADVGDKEHPGPHGHWAQVPFNKGPALLAHAVATELGVAPLAGVFCIDSSSPLARACLDVLEHYADVVVRG